MGRINSNRLIVPVNFFCYLSMAHSRSGRDLDVENMKSKVFHCRTVVCMVGMWTFLP